MQGKKIWILVADGTTARILESSGRGHPLSLVDTFTAAAAQDLIEDSDQPGRVYESSDSARHSLQSEDSVARKTAMAFSRKLAGALSQALERKKFESLILVASPRLLGDLKQHLDKHVGSRVIATVDRDLTRESEAEIAHRLAEIAPI